MIRQKYFSLVLAILFSAFLLGCNDDDGPGDGLLDVEGTWQGTVTFSSCTPAAVCADAGFTQGTTLIAIMDLNQDRNEVEGTYTYQGAGVNAEVGGNVGANQLMIDGAANNPLGRVTVNLVGTVTSGAMNSTISHQVTLTDGRSGTVAGTGIFIKS